MAYLHCHACSWSQDDFWDPESPSGKGYNPLNSADDMMKDLFRDKIHFDDNFFRENPEIPHRRDERGPFCTGRDYVAWQLERKARNIRNMVVPTWEEWRKVRDTFKCPECGRDDRICLD